MSYTKERAGILLQGPIADRPAASSGQYWYLSDEGGLYHSTGSVWTTIQAPGTYQPLDSDLTAIAALSTTSFGRSLLALADAAAARTALSLVVGTDVEAHDTDLTTIAGLSPSNDDIVQRKSGAWANRTMAQLIADLAALGTTFQPLDSDLTSIAALSTTSFGRSLLTMADAAAARTALNDWDSITQVSGSAFTTSNTSLTDITALTYAAAASGLYEVDIVLDIATSADTNGCRYGVGFSAAGSTASFDYHGGAATLASSILNGAGVQSGNILTASSAVGHFRIHGILRTGANAGNITAQAMKVTSGTATVQIGSIMRVKKLV